MSESLVPCKALPFLSLSSIHTCGKAGASKVACNGEIPAAPLGCPPLPAILYMSPGFFEGGSYGRLAGERFVFARSRTLGMLLHALTQVIQMLDAHVPRARHARDQLLGLGSEPCGAPAEGCGLTPPAVCVTVSHGKQRSPGELQARG